jgi:hypothetical protein
MRVNSGTTFTIFGITHSTRRIKCIQTSAGYEKVVFHATLGEQEKAFAELNKFYEVFGCVLKVDPLLDPLRDDPRFTEFMQRVGLT